MDFCYTDPVINCALPHDVQAFLSRSFIALLKSDNDIIVVAALSKLCDLLHGDTIPEFCHVVLIFRKAITAATLELGQMVGSPKAVAAASKLFGYAVEWYKCGYASHPNELWKLANAFRCERIDIACKTFSALARGVRLFLAHDQDEVPEIFHKLEKAGDWPLEGFCFRSVSYPTCLATIYTIHRSPSW